MAIVIGRFIPFVRTFVPFVAGVAEMSYPRFAFYNILGAFIWVGSLTTLGYVVGDHPWVKENFSWVALAMIVVLRSRRSGCSSEPGGAPFGPRGLVGD